MNLKDFMLVKNKNKYKNLKILNNKPYKKKCLMIMNYQ